jgi:hypothetical protein
VNPRASVCVQTFFRCLVPLVIACGGESPQNPPVVDGSVDPDGSMVEIDAPVQPIAPEILVMNEARPNSIDAYLGDIYWTTDPSTGKGQVKKLAPGGQPQVLAAQEDRPVAIDVGEGFIEDTAFWGLDSLLGQVRQIATSGAPPLSSVNANDVVYCLTLDGDRVFVGTRGEVKSKNLTNTSTLTTLAGGYGNGVLAIDADATGVVFGARTTQGAWIVGSMARTGGTVTTLYTGATLIRDVAIVGPNVVWLEANRIMRVARSGGTAAMVALVSDGTPWAVTSAGGTLFVATNQGVINPSGATGTILEVDPISGTKTELAKDQPEPHDIAVDANYVYWANYGIGVAAGQIVRLKR